MKTKEEKVEILIDLFRGQPDRNLENRMRSALGDILSSLPSNTSKGGMITCECGNIAPLKYSIIDEDGIWNCPTCCYDMANKKLISPTPSKPTDFDLEAEAELYADGLSGEGDYFKEVEKAFIAGFKLRDHFPGSAEQQDKQLEEFGKFVSENYTKINEVYRLIDYDKFLLEGKRFYTISELREMFQKP